jgi:hypothetical protein
MRHESHWWSETQALANHDRFDIAFLRYVWSFPVKQRPRILAGIAQFGDHLRVVRLGYDREAEDFVTTVGSC